MFSLLGLALLATPTITIDTGKNPLSASTNAQAMEIYFRCYARAAAEASRTNTPLDAVSGKAKTACAPVRTVLMQDHQKDDERIKVLNAIDAYHAATLPTMIKEARQRLGNPPPQSKASGSNAPNQ